ncbi:MAG: AAA family ATPase, partial [Actinomycetota bacterium]
MNLRDYVDIVWRRKFVVLTIIALGVLAALLVDTPDGPDQGAYSGSLTLAMNEGENFADLLLIEQVAVRTNTIVNAVAADLGSDYFGSAVDTAAVVAASADLTVDPTVGTLRVTVVELPSEETAGAVLLAYGDAVIDYATGRRTESRDESLSSLRRREESILARIDQLDSELTRLRAGQSAEEREQGVDPDRVTTAQLSSNLASLTSVQESIAVLEDQAAEDLVPISYIGTPEIRQGVVVGSPLSTGQKLLIGIVLSSALGIGLAIALQRFDTRVYGRKDAEAAFRLPVLAEVPTIRWWSRRRPGLFTKSNPASSVSESYRLLRSGVAHARSTQLDRADDGVGGDGGAVVLVTSVEAQVGKTTTVANLAVAAVDAGMTVLVVGADLREPSLHEYFKVDPVVGITDAVRGQVATGRAVLDPYIVKTVLPGVSLLGHGEWVQNPGETLAQIRPLLALAKQDFDLVLIDTPPMLAGNDVSELVPFSDLVLLVARAGRSTVEEAQWAEEVATRLEAPLCGVVLIGARRAFDPRRRSLVRRITRRVLRRSAYPRWPSRTGQLPGDRLPGVPAKGSSSASHDLVGGATPTASPGATSVAGSAQVTPPMPEPKPTPAPMVPSATEEPKVPASEAKPPSIRPTGRAEAPSRTRLDLPDKPAAEDVLETTIEMSAISLPPAPEGANKPASAGSAGGHPSATSATNGANARTNGDGPRPIEGVPEEILSVKVVDKADERSTGDAEGSNGASDAATEAAKDDDAIDQAGVEVDG